MEKGRTKGFLVASITAFDKEDHLCPEMQHTLMEKNVEDGAVGFLIGGSSAECPLLTHEERIQCFETAASFSKRESVSLMANIASISTAEAIEYARKAKELHFDSIISTVPYYYKFGMKGIASFFSEIREKVDLPLYLYNFPGNTEIEIDIDHPDIERIIKDGTLDGIKQTSLNLYQLERIKDKNPDLIVYGGYDEVYLGARILGADGAIGSTFNFTLPLFTEIEKQYKEKNIDEAQKLQNKANNIMYALVKCSLFPSIKYILKEQGIDCGKCRKPFPELTEDQKKYILNVVKENMIFKEI